MVLSYIKKAMGDKQEKGLKKYYKIIEKINSLEEQFTQLPDQELKHKTVQFKEALAEGKTIFDIQAEAFATVREASRRVLGMRHYDVQMIGGLVLTEGNIAEMPTGEGKTLVASLPSYLRALEGKGVHVITVNDYLAKRDCELVGAVHTFLGLTIGLNIAGIDYEKKKEAYNADITYGVGTEFGFDHLRDNTVIDLAQRVQRPYHFAIIDEIDSVLIDEAKTPLIIAGKSGVSYNLHQLCAQIVKGFVKDEDYHFDEETKATGFTEQGIEKIEKGFGIDNLYDVEHQTLYHYMIQALRAHVMFQKDVDYIVKDDEIVLVDAFTGRTMEGRTLSNGLHQALEAKESVTITEENKTQASITIQNYFRLYPTLSGMTGTAKTEEKEFQQVYAMDVIQIPTNRPILRIDESDQIYETVNEKYKAVTKEVIRVHQTGQPILIGTTSIRQSETIAQSLQDADLSFQLLNAKSVEQEVELISKAGTKGQITIATNMAGRGTDIKLEDGVEDLGGLFVLGTERHESRRIDNQLKGRAGRQGDKGRSQFFISLEDEMFVRFAHEEVTKLRKNLHKDSTGLIQSKKTADFVDKVQRICEGSNYGIREYNLKLDNVINEQRGVIYELRNRILTDESILTLLTPMISSTVHYYVEGYCSPEVLPEDWDLNSLATDLTKVIGESISLDMQGIAEIQDVQDQVEEATQNYLNLIKEVMEEEKPLDGFLRTTVLQITDREWIKHIENMERLKEGIGMRSYSQEDPMRQYQREGLELFSNSYQELEYYMAEALCQATASLRAEK